MAYTRIYENIYTFNVSSGVVNNGSKVYFDPCPELNKKTIKGLSISNYNNTISGGSIPLNFYITLIDKKNQIICYNYPLVDLLDASNTLFSQFKLRLFNLYDLDLYRSYYFFSSAIPLSFPPYETMFKINFYLE
jgi:hypothetical protein